MSSTIPVSFGTTATRTYTPTPWDSRETSALRVVPEKFPLFFDDNGRASADTGQIPGRYSVGDEKLIFAGVSTVTFYPSDPNHRVLSNCCVTNKDVTNVVYLCQLPIFPGEFLVTSFLRGKIPYIGPLYGLAKHVDGTPIPAAVLEAHLKGRQSELPSTEATRKKARLSYAVSSHRSVFLLQMSTLCAMSKPQGEGVFYVKREMRIDHSQPLVYVVPRGLSVVDLQNLFFFELAKRIYQTGIEDEDEIDEKLENGWFDEIKIEMKTHQTNKTLPREPVDYDIGIALQHDPTSMAWLGNIDLFSVVGVALTSFNPSKFVKHNDFYPLLGVKLWI